MSKSNQTKKRSIPAVKRSIELIKIAQEDLKDPLYCSQISVEGIQRVKNRVLISYLSV